TSGLRRVDSGGPTGSGSLRGTAGGDLLNRRRQASASRIGGASKRHPVIVRDPRAHPPGKGCLEVSVRIICETVDLNV
ncbi:hypothetical protein EJB05_00328, partial [Eragrostis curvula]